MWERCPHMQRCWAGVHYTGGRGDVWHPACTTCCGSLRVISPSGRLHAEATDAEKSHVVHACVHTCGCRASTCGPAQWKGHLCGPSAHTWLHECHYKKTVEQVSCFLTGSTLNVFHLQMWTGALPPRHWPTTRHWHTACSSVASLTTWKPSGTNNASFTIYAFSENVIENRRIWSHFLLAFNHGCRSLWRPISFLVAWLVFNDCSLLAHVQSFSVFAGV